MSLKIVLTAVVAAAFAVAIPVNSTTAQTATTKEETTKDKAAEKKAKAEARKAKKAEKKAAATASRERQKQCGAEWKKARADGKVEKGMTWPKYYSACNKRLKEKTA